MTSDGARDPGEDEFEAQMKKVFQSVLADNLPSLEERISKRVLATAEAAITQRVADAKAEVDTYRTRMATTDEASPKDLAATIRWGMANLPKVLSETLDSYDKLVTIRMKLSNPYIMMTELHKSNPKMVEFVAQQFAPDPLQAYLPGLLAKNSLDTANAVARVLVRQGLMPGGGGRFAVDPFDEPSEESEPPSDEQTPRTAVMSRRRGPRPRPVTLREALA